MKRSKAYRAGAEKLVEGKVYAPLEAVRLAKETSATKYDATVEVAMRLGVDPRKADQMVRGIAEVKMTDLNANDIDAAEKIIAGTARSMGITVES